MVLSFRGEMAESNRIEHLLGQLNQQISQITQTFAQQFQQTFTAIVQEQLHPIVVNDGDNKGFQMKIDCPRPQIHQFPDQLIHDKVQKEDLFVDETVDQEVVLAKLEDSNPSIQPFCIQLINDKVTSLPYNDFSSSSLSTCTAIGEIGINEKAFHVADNVFDQNPEQNGNIIELKPKPPDDYGPIIYRTMEHILNPMKVMLNYNTEGCDKFYKQLDEMMFCGIFDGHGSWGHFVAKTFRESRPLSLLCNWQEALIKTSIDLDIELKSDKRLQRFNLWNHLYLKACATINRELKQHYIIDSFHSGTTGITVVRQGELIVVANVGNSCAVLGTTSGDGSLIPVQFTFDFKPKILQEAERISSNWYLGVCYDRFIILAFSVTGVKPMTRDSSLQLGPNVADVEKQFYGWNCPTLLYEEVQGILGVQTSFPENSPQFRGLKKRFQENFKLDYPEEEIIEPGIFVAQVYDATWILAWALDESDMNSRGEKLLEEVSQSNFNGLGGNVHSRGRKVVAAYIFHFAYDDLVEQAYLENFAVADYDIITILANRTRHADFTRPYSESRLEIIVIIKSKLPNEVRLFMKPFTIAMWGLTCVIIIYTGFVLWLIHAHSHLDLSFLGPYVIIPSGLDVLAKHNYQPAGVWEILFSDVYIALHNAGKNCLEVWFDNVYHMKDQNWPKVFIYKLDCHELLVQNRRLYAFGAWVQDVYKFKSSDAFSPNETRPTKKTQLVLVGALDEQAFHIIQNFVVWKKYVENETYIHGGLNIVRNQNHQYGVRIVKAVGSINGSILACLGVTFGWGQNFAIIMGDTLIKLHNWKFFYAIHGLMIAVTTWDMNKIHFSNEAEHEILDRYLRVIQSREFFITWQFVEGTEVLFGSSKEWEGKSVVSACSHVGEHKYAGNLIIFNPDSDGKVYGHLYGYVAPANVFDHWYGYDSPSRGGYSYREEIPCYRIACAEMGNQIIGFHGALPP